MAWKVKTLAGFASKDFIAADRPPTHVLLAQIRIERRHDDRLKRAPRRVLRRVRAEPRVPSRIEPER